MDIFIIQSLNFGFICFCMYRSDSDNISLSAGDLLDMPTGSNNCLIFVYKLSCVNIYQMMWNIVRLSDQSEKYDADRFNCWQDGRAVPGVTLLLGVSHHGTL